LNATFLTLGPSHNLDHTIYLYTKMLFLSISKKKKK